MNSVKHKILIYIPTIPLTKKEGLSRKIHQNHKRKSKVAFESRSKIQMDRYIKRYIHRFICIKIQK